MNLKTPVYLFMILVDLIFSFNSKGIIGLIDIVLRFQPIDGVMILFFVMMTMGYERVPPKTTSIRMYAIFELTDRTYQIQERLVQLKL